MNEWRDTRDRPLAFWALLALLGLLGVSGLAGGAQFVLDPAGGIVGISTAELAGSPFADYLVPGIVLFVVLGVAPLVVCYGLLRTRRWAWPAAIAVGLALAIWVLVEGVGHRLRRATSDTALYPGCRNRDPRDGAIGPGVSRFQSRVTAARTSTHR